MKSQWERVLERYGPIGAIALFLVWWLATDTSGDIRGMADDLQRHVAETNHYLYQICVNTGQTEAQRAACRR